MSLAPRGMLDPSSPPSKDGRYSNFKGREQEINAILARDGMLAWERGLVFRSFRLNFYGALGPGALRAFQQLAQSNYSSSPNSKRCSC
jgi:hypothetical protein